jgi:hypothetical protein
MSQSVSRRLDSVSQSWSNQSSIEFSRISQISKTQHVTLKVPIYYWEDWESSLRVVDPSIPAPRQSKSSYFCLGWCHSCRDNQSDTFCGSSQHCSHRGKKAR